MKGLVDKIDAKLITSAGGIVIALYIAFLWSGSMQGTGNDIARIGAQFERYHEENMEIQRISNDEKRAFTSAIVDLTINVKAQTEIMKSQTLMIQRMSR